MVSSGDWLVPRMRARSACRSRRWPTGRGRSCRAARPGLAGGPAPAVAGGGGGAALVTFAWGRRIGGARLGPASAACLAAMELFIAYGRRGVAELQLALYCNLALLVFDQLLERPTLALRAAFGLALGLALLAKATAGLMIVLLPVALTLILQRRWRGPRLAPRNWSGRGGHRHRPGVVRRDHDARPRGLADAPGRAAAAAGPGRRSRGPAVGRALPPGLVPLLFAAAGATPAAGRAAGLGPAPRAEHPPGRASCRARASCSCVFASLFVAFTLLPQKQKHYMVPLLPTLAILLGRGGAGARAPRAAGFGDRQTPGLRRGALGRCSRWARRPCARPEEATACPWPWVWRRSASRWRCCW